MDILARTLGPHLQAAWGQAVIVENRPGASGNLGAGAVAKSPSDGLTLVMGVNTLIINPALYSNMTYDPLKDLAPIGLAATGSFLLVASSASKLKSVDDLVKAARAKPGALDYGIARHRHAASHGDGTAQGARQGRAHPYPVLQHRRRRECGPALGRRAADVPARARGDGAGQEREAGRACHRGRPRRSPLAPEVPTLAEQGLKGVDADLWYGLLGAARSCHRPLVTRIHDAMRRCWRRPKWRPRWSRKEWRSGEAGTAARWPN